ncbi:limbic system-associated membrane protein-like isoform X2 [Dysidea avara]|uniref:limbic system-associated membrane protein-like isoform X2 n=1 Tax=Dysidea avara TaxID=196820 RepID=UPI00331B6110
MMSFTFVFFISALHITGVRSVKVGVSSNFVANSPTLAEYFVEERHARLKCYIIGEGDTNTTGSSWYRNFSNGTIHQFTDSDPERVRVHENTLVFWPKVIRSDQGWYRCCVSTAVCSNFTYVKLYVAPIIDATRLNYIAFIGSHVTLTCEINNWGNPKATISWKKPEEQYFSNDPITTNETHTSLILPNVTTVHGGKYVCDADSILSGDVGELYLHIQVPPQIIMGGPMIAHIGEMVNITCTILKGRPAPDINISTPTGDITKNNNITFSATLQHTGDFVCTANTSKLIVTEKRFLFVYDIDNTTSYLHFLVLIHSHDCHFKTSQISEPCDYE